jgi:hypothetical protein
MLLIKNAAQSVDVEFQKQNNALTQYPYNWRNSFVSWKQHKYYVTVANLFIIL